MTKKIHELSANKPSTCAYCDRPLTKRVVADEKPYCNRLCAAFGLIRETIETDGVYDVADALAVGMERLTAGEKPLPVRVRDCDMDQALATLPPDQLVIEIDNDGTPDWTPAELPQAS